MYWYRTVTGVLRHHTHFLKATPLIGCEEPDRLFSLPAVSVATAHRGHGVLGKDFDEDLGTIYSVPLVAAKIGP